MARRSVIRTEAQPRLNIHFSTDVPVDRLQRSAAMSAPDLHGFRDSSRGASSCLSIPHSAGDASPCPSWIGEAELVLGKRVA